jgi:hypothetical protein
LGCAYGNVGAVLSDAGEVKAAREAYGKAIARFDALVASHPGVPDYQEALAHGYSNLCNVIGGAGEAHAARESYERDRSQSGRIWRGSTLNFLTSRAARA